ncbi:scarecrow-like protein 32 [Gastrolobium bilobum]|uniref:scarecrow-like protein 32 n=1 Tax=Gastrolobium bilobum TaxID=150636 RepID=UPI002AB2C657|nr:scarecrow-like protein 32 [Gastrolobium bilobum]
MKAELKGTTTTFSFQNPTTLFNTPHSPLSGALKGCLGSLDGACIEKLLLHCASALESNDVTLAQQVMWVLNNVASPVGDTNQRLTSWFLRALISRASRICPAAMNFKGSNTIQRRLMTLTELAGYVDLIPWHRFGFCASNNEIFKTIMGFQRVHILDFSITHCMQWPTFIDALAKRPEGPSSLRITVPSCGPQVPPLVNISIHEVGLRLGNFAKFRGVPFEFNVIGNTTPLSSAELSNESSSFNFESLLSLLNPTVLNLREDEALVINCQNWLRYLSDDRKGSRQNLSLRDAFLNLIKGLNPRIVLLVDEDCDLSASSLTSRITTCFNHLWIPFDALETFLPKDSCQRTEFESDIGQKIENIISFEGHQRIERLESGMQMSQRMKNAGYLSLPFCDETVREVKALLDEHASGWGMKREEGMLVLTWKGNSCVFATAWVPSEIRDNIGMDSNMS